MKENLNHKVTVREKNRDMKKIPALSLLSCLVILSSCAPKFASVEAPLSKNTITQEKELSSNINSIFQNVPKGLIIAESQELLAQKVEEYAKETGNFKILQALDIEPSITSFEPNKVSITKLKDYKYRIKLQTESAYNYIQIKGTNEEGNYSRRIWVAYILFEPTLAPRSVSAMSASRGDPINTAIFGGLYEEPQEVEFDLYIYKQKQVGTELDHDENHVLSPNSFPLSYDEGYFKYTPFLNGIYTLYTQPVYHRATTPRGQIVYSPYGDFNGFCSLERDYDSKEGIFTYTKFSEGPQRREYFETDEETGDEIKKTYFINCKTVSGELTKIKFPTNLLGIKDIDDPLQIKTLEIVDGEEKEINEFVFSPRDENLDYDKLSLFISVPEEDTAWKALLKPNDDNNSLNGAYPIISELKSEISGVGSQEREWNGFSGDICTRDGYYEMLIVKDTADPLNLTEEDIYQRENFYVDNTAPITKDISITEVLLNEETQEYKTDIVFLLKDPKVQPATPLLPSKAIGMYDETEDFNVNSFKELLTVKADSKDINQDLQIREVTKGVVEVKFTLPYKLGTKNIDVEMKDRIGNTAYSILNNPAEGGN